jgi:hypothetical protein
VQPRLKRTLATFAVLAAATFIPSLARADSVTVDTALNGVTSDPTTVWTVADPTAGNYTVTVSGANRSTSSSDHNNYYRNSSNAGTTEDDRTITWTVSGLNPLYQITSFSLGTTKIVPSQGSGSNWNYATTLTGNDTTNGAVTSSQSFPGTTGPFGPMTVNGSFGAAPAFTLFIDESGPTLTSRTIGTYNFTIVASPLDAPPTPEPASLGILAIGAVALLAKRRK